MFINKLLDIFDYKVYNIFVISWKGDAFAQYRLIEKLSKGKVILRQKNRD